MKRRSADALAREIDAHERLLQSMRERAPRAQALREEVEVLLGPFPPGTWKVLEMVLIELATLADSGVEVREDTELDVRELMAEVRPPTERRHVVEGCGYCAEFGHESGMPHHDPSPKCNSGKRPHCTCEEACF